MINKIELINWKTHKDTSLDFARGTNILIGQMGSGKSTVMDAISFALFGKYPAIQHRHVAVNDIIMNKPQQEKNAEVKLDFSFEGDKYRVRRSLELDGTSKATIEKNSSYLQSQPQRVNEEIESVLKIDYDLFSKAIYAEQNRLTSFLDFTPKERKQYIDGLLGLDKFANAQDNITSLVNRIRADADENEKTVGNFNIKELEKEYAELSKELDSVAEENAKLEKDLNEEVKRKSEIEKELQDAKGKYEEKVRLGKEIADIKSRLAVLEKEIEKVNKNVTKGSREINADFEKSKSDLERIKKELNAAESLERESVRKWAGLEASMKLLEKEVDERTNLEKDIRGISGDGIKMGIEELKSALKKLQLENGLNVSKKEENEKWLREVEKHISKCPVCERELSEEIRKKIVAEKTAAIKELEDAVKNSGKEIGLKEKELEKLEAELKSFEKKEQRIRELGDSQKKLNELKAASEQGKKEMEKIRSSRSEKQEEFDKANKKFMVLNSEKEMSDRRDGYLKESEEDKIKLAKKEKEAEKIDVDEKAIDSLHKKYAEIGARFSEFKARLDSGRRIEADKKVQVAGKKEEMDSVNEIYNSIEKKRRIAGELAKYKSALEEAQTAQRTMLITYINQIMQEMWPELYPYEDYQGISLDANSDDYTLMVKTGRNGGMWEEVGTIASGGEKSIACLALRTALALVLVPNLKWLILDEPTHNLDRQGLDKFVRAVNEVLPKLVDQIFIITHDETLTQATNAKIYMLKRDKELGKETIAEAIN